jgi:hypothetical protein
MVQSLMHKFIVEDSTKCFTAMPDYVLVFTKKGENLVPVTHPFGMNHYAGEVPILPNILRAWNNANNSNLNEVELWEHLNNINEDDKITKLNHYIWQRYARLVYGMTFVLIMYYLSRIAKKKMTKSTYTLYNLM